MEEERRLFFVGATRAMQGLYLFYAFRRTLYGNLMANTPSRFLADIPADLLAGATPPPPALAADSMPMRPRYVEPSRPWSPAGGQAPQRLASAATSPPTLPRSAPTAAGTGDGAAAGPQFRPGDRVRHKSFGDGIVVASQIVRNDEEVTVAFEGKGVKKLSVAYAGLERR